MYTIQIVTNPDRCHVSVDGQPVATFVYWSYPEVKEENKAEHALHDAKVECFNVLARYNKQGLKAIINPDIVQK